MNEQVLNPESSTEVVTNSSGYLQERRYLWTARVFAVFGSVSICANIILFIAIFNLVPLVRIEPFLFNFVEKNEQVVQIKPLNVNMAKNDIVTESMVRYYVLVRNTLVKDISVMRSRWGSDGPVKWMSSDANYRDFSNKSIGILDRIKDEGLSRMVTIYSVVRLSNNVWQAEILTKDTLSSSSAPVETKWTVDLLVEYVGNMRVKYSQRLKNPLGFVVKQYQIKRNS